MATSETELHEETDILNCQICYLKLKDPKELKCRCVFCHACIKRHFRSPNHIKCPACKKHIDKPPEVKDVSRPLEKLLGTDKDARCTCESPGCKQSVRVPYICVKCQLWLCQVCKTSVCHGVAKDIQSKPSHETCPSKHVTPELNRILMSNKYNECSIHEQKFLFYCEKCHECACDMCKYTKHPHHDLIDIKTKADEHLELLLLQNTSLKKKVQEYETAMMIYRKIVDSPSTPTLISRDQCRTILHRCQLKAEKCDALRKCIMQLKTFGSKEAILLIGWDIQEAIIEEINLFPLRDIQATAELGQSIETMLHTSSAKERNTTVGEEMDNQQNIAMTGTSETVPNVSRKVSRQSVATEITSECSKKVKRTIQTRASASTANVNNNHREIPARSSITNTKTVMNQTTGVSVSGSETVSGSGSETVSGSGSETVSGSVPDQREASTSGKEKSFRGVKHDISKIKISANIPDRDQGKKTGKMAGKSSITVKRTIQTRSRTRMKRTIQTRSCGSVVLPGQGVRELGGSKAKRARMTAHGVTNCYIGAINDTIRTRKGCTGTFQSVSKSAVRHASFTLSNRVDEAKTAIALSIGEKPTNIDIVDNWRVIEGSDLVRDIQRPLQVVVHNSNRQVPVTLQTLLPDILNDWEEGARVQMSCGHAITPDNLYAYSWTQLENQKSSFRCFADVNGRDCDKEWLFAEVADKACLSNDEHFLFESRIYRNWMNHSEGVRECPSCGIVCERDTTYAYVDCLNCKRAEKNPFRFCWYCLSYWTVKHTCKKSEVQQMLNCCKRKEIVEIRGCPSLRACPECHTFIEHTEGCKHMTCMDCHCTFCFVCLEVRGNNGFACGSYDSKCDVAPIQKVT